MRLLIHLAVGAIFASSLVTTAILADECDDMAFSGTSVQSVLNQDPLTLLRTDCTKHATLFSSIEGALVPFDGFVGWRRGLDHGKATIEAKALVPARGLVLDVVIRKDSESSLMVFDLSFSVPADFRDGLVTGVSGIDALNKDRAIVASLIGGATVVAPDRLRFTLIGGATVSGMNESALLDASSLNMNIQFETGNEASLIIEKGESGDTIFREVIGEWKH